MPDKRHSRRKVMKTTGALSATGIVGLAGCTSDDGSDGEDGEMADEIVFYNSGALDADPGTAHNIERFEEETGISVEVNEVPWSNLKTSLTTIWRNQDNKVDVFNGPTWWLADFVNSGWLEPIDLGDDHVGNWPDDLVDLVTFDGDVYMAPEFGKWGNFLYDTNSIDSPPETWEEVLELDVDDQSEFGFTWADKDVFMFKQFIYQAGGQLFDGGEPVFNEQAGLDVLEFITDLRDEDMLPNGLSSMGEGDLNDSFLAGQLATVSGWTPLGATALGHDDWGEDRLGSALPPEGPGGSRATFQDTNGIAISAYSDRKQAAQKFAEFMTTRESAKQNMLVEGNPCVVPDVYEDDEIQNEYPSEFLDHMRTNLENARSETYQAQPQVDDFLSEQISEVLVNDKDPQQALDDAYDNVESLYQDIGIL